MNNTIVTSRMSSSSGTQVPAVQFLFSGRGPLRRAQIEVLCSRSGLQAPSSWTHESKQARVA
jgi:hypothetical protein